MRRPTSAESLVAGVVDTQFVVEGSLSESCMVHWTQAAIILLNIGVSASTIFVIYNWFEIIKIF